MAKRRRTPPLPSCYSTDGGVKNGNDGNLGDDLFVPYVEHHDGRQFWSDRFYLNSSEIEVRDGDCDCRCGSLQAPSTFPLVDFVNQSLDVKAAVMGTFNIHPQWFRESFPRFGERRRTEKEFNDTEDGDKDDVSVASNTTVPTFILHGHRGLENALSKRVKQADEVEYETDREADDVDRDVMDSKIIRKSKSGKRNSPCPIKQIDGNSSSKFKFFLPSTAKATETARHFVNNPDLKMCQVHCNWENKSRNNASSNISLRVSSSDKENSENDETSKITNNTNRETKFGVHHPKFMLLFEQSGDLVVIVTTSNLTPTNQCTVEGSWVQRFRRRTKKDKQDVKSFARNLKQNSPCNQHQQHQENDFGPVLQDFLVQLSEAAAVGAERIERRAGLQIPLANNDDKRGNRENSSSSTHLPLEEFLSKHIGLKSLADFSSLYHFETAQTYLVPIVPGDYKYDPSDGPTTMGGDDNQKPSNRYFYGRQRVRYILEKLATSTPKISKKTQDKSKSDRLVLQPTSLGNDWSRSQFASLVREYMGYYSGGNINNNRAPTKNDETPNTLAKRKPHKKQKTNQDYSYYRDDFWVCRQADIVWPSDRFMVGVAKSTQSGAYNNNIISPLQAASAMVRNGERGESLKRARVMNSFVFNSSRTFNACDLEFISRMAKYMPSTPCQLHQPSNNTGYNVYANNITSAKPAVSKAPHFKSIARLFQNHVAMQKRDVPPADAYFSWFLLTSACLSTGAQGATVESCPNRKQQGGNDKINNRSSSASLATSSVASTVAYRNFELGVLFTSHLPKKCKMHSKTKGSSAIDSKVDQEKQRRSLVYCFHPHRCSCRDDNTSSTSSPLPQLVHLPVPYNLRPESYFQKGSKDNDYDDDDDDDEDMVMQENPFFHEIANGSRCIGNMLLTPFGQCESNQTEL